MHGSASSSSIPVASVSGPENETHSGSSTAYKSTNTVRQRASVPTPATGRQSLSDAGTEPEQSSSSNMDSVRSVVVVISLLGVISFSTLAYFFSTRYNFLGFHGNMEEAASSCRQTAVLFGITAFIAIFPTLTALFKAKKKAQVLKRKQVLPGNYRR